MLQFQSWHKAIWAAGRYLAHVNAKGKSTTTATREIEGGQHDVNHWMPTPNIFSSFSFLI